MTANNALKRACNGPTSSRLDYIPSTSFDAWFSSYLGQDPFQVQLLLRNGMATCFLIAWSLFESKCFDGFVKMELLSSFAEETCKNKNISLCNLKGIADHFHERYQDQNRLRNLLHGQKIKGLTEIIRKQYVALDDREIIYLLLVVVYRFRNNIFHGNKGVSTWLTYRTQIEMCTHVMQSLITLRETSHEAVTRPPVMAKTNFCE